MFPRTHAEKDDGQTASLTDRAAVRRPPGRGRANAALEKLLARALDVPRGAVRTVAGIGSRSKVV
jgi:uncharacterized protein YggU (UPF0235/DUF167 family)